jgi:site-specific DNA-methyltransferase (adenine-specific)
MKIELYNSCNMQLMSKYPDKYFDMAIVDPPYGLNISNGKKGNFVMTKHKPKKWDIQKPPKEYFEELFRVSKNQIIWGGNYFDLPLKKGWICWDKCNPLPGKFSDFELAWTSFLNCDVIYKQAWIGFGRKFLEKDDSIHPTQKPIKLYQWILKNYTKEGYRILDTHLGSGSIAIACHRMNFDLVACEIDQEYYEAAVNRLRIEQTQMVLF